MERKIDLTVAKAHLFEIRYKTQKSDTEMFAVGLAAGDGFAISNKLKNGKGYVGKNISSTHIKHGESPTLLVFEGFIDAFSFLTAYPSYQKTDIYILNSTNLAEKATKEIETFSYQNIRLLLDNDKAGDKATEIFKKAFSETVSDERFKYSDYNDINDMICKKPFLRD